MTRRTATGGRRNRSRTALALVSLIVWSWIYAGGVIAVRDAVFGDDVGIVYSDRLVPGRASIVGCRPDHPTPFICTARIAFDGVTTRGEPAPSCWAHEVRSPRVLVGDVAVIGHYTRSGRSPLSCAYATTTDYPHLSPDRERTRTIFTVAVVVGFVLWVLAWIALAAVLPARWRRWVGGRAVTSDGVARRRTPRR